jgi:hypothetical protein
MNYKKIINEYLNYLQLCDEDETVYEAACSLLPKLKLTDDDLYGSLIETANSHTGLKKSIIQEFILYFQQNHEQERAPQDYQE